MWEVHHDTYVEGLLELTPEGQYLLEAYNNVLADEGIGSVNYFPELETYTSYPNSLLDEAADHVENGQYEEIKR